MHGAAARTWGVPARSPARPPTRRRGPQARNARQAEQRLLNISRHHGRGYLNRQRNSNYQDYPGYVYVVVGRILDLRTGRLVHPGMPPPQECCAIM